MGGFQLVEPDDEREISPSSGKPEVDTGQQGVDKDSPTMVTAVQRTVDPEKVPVSSKGRVTILTPEMLEELVKDPDFKIPISERELNDKSRADVVSKVIFVFQTWWFTTQCIARGVQGLELTQLELTTVAFTSLNVITFIFWMKKPLGAQVPIRVPVGRKLTAAERDVAGLGVSIPCNLLS